jgi:hypothetical protein
MNRALPETCGRCGSQAMVRVTTVAGIRLVCATCGNGRENLPARSRKRPRGRRRRRNARR